MPKLLISLPTILSARIEDAVNMGGYASKAELIRQAVSILLDEQEKSWAAHRARRDAFLIQKRGLDALQTQPS